MTYGRRGYSGSTRGVKFERKYQIDSASGMRDDGDGGSIDER